MGCLTKAQLACPKTATLHNSNTRRLRVSRLVRQMQVGATYSSKHLPWRSNGSALPFATPPVPFPLGASSVFGTAPPSLINNAAYGYVIIRGGSASNTLQTAEEGFKMQIHIVS